ncbi:MAG: glycosyltransferase, partial [Actinomycetota bacterium]
YVTGRGIQRSFHPRALLDNVVAAVGLLRALGKVVVQVQRWRPKVVVSAGGYAAFPAVVASLVLRIPLVLVNIDAIPGAVHRIFGRFAVCSCVGFEGTPLPHPIVTGAPLSRSIIEASATPDARRQARERLGLGEGRVLAVVGGSLGARSLNSATSEFARLGHPDLEIYHVAGRRDFADLQRAQEQFAPDPTYHLVPFEQEMASLYVAADVVLARSGAMTVAELAAIGVPSILVPLPTAPGDHQTKNAAVLANAGAAIVVPDSELTANKLQELLDGLTPDRLSQMRSAAGSVHTSDAAAKIAQVVTSYVR